MYTVDSEQSSQKFLSGERPDISKVTAGSKAGKNVCHDSEMTLANRHLTANYAKMSMRKVEGCYLNKTLAAKQLRLTGRIVKGQ
jgi:hypothetical protein